MSRPLEEFVGGEERWWNFKRLETGYGLLTWSYALRSSDTLAWLRVKESLRPDDYGVRCGEEGGSVWREKIGRVWKLWREEVLTRGELFFESIIFENNCEGVDWKLIRKLN